MQLGERLDRTFHALADPTRRRILEQLAQADLTVMELANRFTISQPAVTKHLHVLEGAGLISRRKSGRLRICRMEPDALATPAEWMSTWSALWNARLDELEKFLTRTQPRS
jgi:DNA-binding transcriptional ArsR family regulator